MFYSDVSDTIHVLTVSTNNYKMANLTNICFQELRKNRGMLIAGFTR
jgi:hypothetical protein